MKPISRLLVVLTCLLGWHAGFAQGDPLLLKEVFTREVSVHVGGLQDPLVREIASREVSCFVGQEPAAPYQQALTREISVLVTTPAIPTRITQLQVTPSPTGETVTLSWAGYNQWANHDVVRYDIYRSSQAFTDVTGLTPVKSVPADNFSYTFTGLPPWQDWFFAVVPVDALGGRDTGVNYAAAYIIAREVVSREFSVFTGAEPASPYQQMVTREVSVVVTTPTVPARITGLQITPSPTGEEVALSWAGYNEWAQHDVVRYDIYRSSQAFTDVTGMAPADSVPGETFSYTFTGLPPWQDRFFAVVPVDARNGFDSGVNYAAAYIIAREVVSRETSVFVGAEPASPYEEALSREISFLVPTPGIPAPVTGLGSTFTAVSSTRAFAAVDLDWTGYNEVGQQDVVRYRIYAGPAYFDNVTGMDPFDYAPAGTTQWTLRNLTPLGIYYLAVVAEDALEQWDPVVRSVSAQSSIGMLGEVRQLAVDCGLDALHFTWLPPAGAEPTVNDFLGGYRVYFGEATTPVALDRFATQFEATGLLPAHAYPFRITTLDKFGVESAGSLIPAGTLMPNPAGLAATPLDGKVRLAWTPEEPAGLVLLYAVYVSETDFTTVEGKTPVLETGAAEAEITGLENGRAYYLAVTTVNTGGCSDPAVQAVRAVPAAQTFALAIGDTVSNGKINDTDAPGAGNVENPGEVDYYTFSVSAGQRVYFDVQAYDFGYFLDGRWRLRSPAGTLVFDQTFQTGDEGPMVLTEPGTYRIEVYDPSGATGTYRFLLSPGTITEHALAIGQVVSDGQIGGTAAPGAGRIEVPGYEDHYLFAASAGERVYFDVQAYDLGYFLNGRWRLRSPAGTLVFDQTFQTGDEGPMVLTEPGTYRIEVYDPSGATGTYQFALNGLRDPVAGDDVAGTVKDQPVLLPIVRLLANDTDPDDDPLTLSLPSAATSEGGVVALSGSHVQYTPPSGFTGTDTFTYQVADGWGGTDTATVTVTVRKPEGIGLNTISAARDADGTVHLRMAGIPGRSYQIWFAPDIVAGPWALLDTVVADLLGVVSYTDTSAVGVPVRFYRLGATP